ncbi:MAG: hypothetical protein M1837_000195 [Sclerophora amabilis]|nr:MAG: hypothetical protein M1837_000195 [Sclerophora amabilis]
MASNTAPQLMAVMPPPPGFVQDFVDPESTGSRILTVNAIFLPLAVLFFIVRMYTRICLTRTPGIDDGLLVTALVFSMGQTTVTTMMIKNGLGPHIWDVPVTTFSPTFLKCIPLAAAWDMTIVRGKCINTELLGIASAALNVFLDLAIIVLPMPTVWKLQLPTRQKAALTAVFGVGAFIVRTVELVSVLKDPDVTRSYVNAYLWSIIEINASIICASMATFRPFLRRYVPLLIGRTVPNPDQRGPASSSKNGSHFAWSTRSYQHRSYAFDDDDAPLGVLEMGDGPQVNVSSGGHGHHEFNQNGDITDRKEQIIEDGRHCIYKTTDVSVSTSEPKVDGQHEF